MHQRFIGTWSLIPESCNYEQGDPPREGMYSIREEGQRLVFVMDWVDAAGDHHQMSFSGVPDGSREPFEGGDLADALAVSAVSDRELNSSAFYRGREVMTAQRQLDRSGNAMRITQVVRFLDGSIAANVSVYRRQVQA